MEIFEWAAPIIPIVKLDGTVQICGDYRLTINRTAKSDTYPLPRIENLFATLSGGKSFIKLDLAHAYSQIPLSESSKQYVTINTHTGLYRYNRLPFGVAAASSIFQTHGDCYRGFSMFQFILMIFSSQALLMTIT